MTKIVRRIVAAISAAVRLIPWISRSTRVMTFFISAPIRIVGRSERPDPLDDGAVLILGAAVPSVIGGLEELAPFLFVLGGQDVGVDALVLQELDRGGVALRALAHRPLEHLPAGIEDRRPVLVGEI